MDYIHTQLNVIKTTMLFRLVMMFIIVALYFVKHDHPDVYSEIYRIIVFYLLLCCALHGLMISNFTEMNKTTDMYYNFRNDTSLHFTIIAITVLFGVNWYFTSPIEIDLIFVNKQMPLLCIEIITSGTLIYRYYDFIESL